MSGDILKSYPITYNGDIISLSFIVLEARFLLFDQETTFSCKKCRQFARCKVSTMHMVAYCAFQTWTSGLLLSLVLGTGVNVE
jgi:hypothetical protein